MFVADMNRIYDDCMEHYKQYKDAFFYSWAKYSKDKLEKMAKPGIGLLGQGVSHASAVSVDGANEDSKNDFNKY